MKFLVGFIFFLNAHVAFAGEATVSSTWTTTKSLQEIRSIVTGVAHLCSHGCTYLMPSVTRSEVVRESASDLIYWTTVESLIDVSFFSRMTVTSNGNELSIISNMIQNAGRYASESRPNSPAPMNNNQMRMTIVDNGNRRTISITLFAASERMVVTNARLTRELTASIEAYKRILN